MRIKPFFLFFCALSLCNNNWAQNHKTKGKILDNVLYVVDYVPMIAHNERDMLSSVFCIPNKDIFSKEIIFDKKKIQQIGGYDGVDTLIVITTNEYHNRPEDIKRIPTFSYNLVFREDKKIYLKDSRTPYTGKFINYYFSGRLLTKGSILNGYLSDSLTTFYEDGITKKRSLYFKNGKREGAATEYFPNGNLKLMGRHSDSLKTGIWTAWYSTGRIKNRLFFEKGKLTLPREDIQWTQLLEKAEDYLKHYDRGQAMQCYENALMMRPDISDIYYANGLLEIRMEHFAAAIKDLDNALQLEPLYLEAIKERILARTRKYVASGKHKKSKPDNDSPDNEPEIPKEEKDKICDDIGTIRLIQEQDHSITLSFFTGFIERLEQKYCK